MLRKIFFYPAIFILCWVYAIRFNDIDYDLWARIAVGKMFFQTGHVLPHDIFSYTPTKEWIDHEWGSGVIFYFLSSKFGDIGLLLLKIILIFTIFFLLTRIIKLQNPKPSAHMNILFYFFVMLGAFFGLFQTIRCQLFTFTFFTLWIYVLERVRRGETRLLWILPATTLIWANLHGGFVAGIGLLVIYGIGEFLNKKPSLKYFLTLIPTFLATLINPYGFKYLQYIFYAITMKRYAIGEWQPTDLLKTLMAWRSLKIVILITLVSIIFYFIKNRPKYCEIDKVKFIAIGVTLYLAVSHIKHQAFFVITAASFIYHDFYAIFETAGNYIKAKKGEIAVKILHGLDLVKNGIIYAFVLGAGSLLMIYNPMVVSIPINKYPLGSVEFVRQNHLKGNLLTVFEWGSYAAWKLYPNCLIALDGRYEEVYSNDLFYNVAYFMTRSNLSELNIYWDDILKKYHTDIIIMGKIGPRKEIAYNAMKEKNDWQLVYEDYSSAVFVRKKYTKRFYKKPNAISLKVYNAKYQSNLDFNKNIYN